MLTHIVAATPDGIIGDVTAPGMLWHCPEDLQYFRKMTEGYVVIVGRKTAETLPAQGLPGRTVVKVSRSGEKGTMSLSAAVAKYPNAFVIGGGEVYQQTAHLTGAVLLTIISPVNWEAPLPGNQVLYRMPPHMKQVESSRSRLGVNAQFYRFTVNRLSWWRLLLKKFFEKVAPSGL